MKIIINGFRCYDSINIDVIPNNVCILPGPNGKGKSTIFAAIYWCLFGSLRNVHYNFGSKTLKTNVTLILKNVKIYRQAGPNLLKVFIDDIEYIDKTAQEHINNIFGEELIWRSTSYIIQKERNIMLTGNINDKIDTLSRMTFYNENIDDYISEIDNYIKNIENSITLNQTLSNTYQIEDINWDKFVKKEDRLQFYEVKEQLENLIPETINRINKNNINTSKIILLNKKIENLKNNIENIENFLVKSDKNNILEKIENTYTQLKNKEVMELNKKKFDEYTKLKKMVKNDLPNINVTHDMITKNKIQESEYIKFSNLAKTNNIDYNKNIIESKIKELNNIILKQVEYKKGEEIRQLIKELEKYTDSEDITFLENEISKLLIEIKNLEHNILNCPHCEKGVIFSNNTLIKSCYAADKKKELPELKLNLEKYNKKYKNIKIKNDILEKLNKYDVSLKNLPSPLTNIELQKLYNSVSTLNNIKIVDKVSINTQILVEVYENNNIIKRLEDLSDVVEVKDEIHVTINDLNMYKTQLKTLENNENSLINYKNELNELNNEVSLLLSEDDSGLEPYLETYKIQLNEINLQIIEWENMDKIEAKKEELNTIMYKIEKDTLTLQNCQTLKKISLDLECEILQITLDKINTYLNSLLKGLFEDPINIKFKLNRTTSKKGRTKPKLELQILYKGGEYDSVSDMCGSEGDRVSLALTLALNQISGSPFILLDETMASFDDDVLVNCIETIKENINKTIICIDHKPIEGFYDHILNIEKV